MYYIDEYKSGAVSNSAPKNQKTLISKLNKISKESKKEQLDAFWRLMGVTIGENYSEVEKILERYGYRVVNEQDAAVAIADLWSTPKWIDFVKEISILIESTIDEKLLESLIPNVEESSWVAALIGAVGSIAGGSLGLASSKKEAEASKENAKAQMIAALAQVNAERERANAERIKAEAEQSKGIYWILGLTIFFVIAIIFAIVIYKRKQNTK